MTLPIARNGSGHAVKIHRGTGKVARSRDAGTAQAPAKTLRAPENPTDRPAERRCLRCRKSFASRGIGNRLCKECAAYARKVGDADMRVSPPTKWAGA